MTPAWSNNGPASASCCAASPVLGDLGFDATYGGATFTTRIVKSAKTFAVDYLQHRENYKLAYHRWLNFNRRLMELFDVEGDAALETAMLQARTDKRHLAELAEYARLGYALDAAGDKWDAAQQWQARRTAATIAQVNKDFATIEC